MCDAAMAARPHVIDGKEVETKRAIPKDVRFHRTRFRSISFLAIDVTKGRIEHDMQKVALSRH